MRARIEWLPPVWELLNELPPGVQDAIVEKVELLARFPLMYPLQEKGRFRRHRRFLAGDWAVYYRVVENTIYIRGVWPARIP